MGEAKDKERRAEEARKLLEFAPKRTAGRVRDRFNRAVQVGDAVMAPSMAAAGVIYRIVDIKPAMEPQFQGGFWVDVMATGRMMLGPGANEDLILVVPGVEKAEEATTPPAQPPGEVKSPGGIILSDPDRISER